MIIVQSSKTSKVQATTTATIQEFSMDEIAISGAVAWINGRYPVKGYAVNEKSKELVYIISGKGKIITKDKEEKFNQGDVIFIENQELFAWEGDFTMFMTTAPKFDPKQHKIV